MIVKLRDGREYISLCQEKTGKEVYIPYDPRVTVLLNKYGGTLPKVYDQKINKRIKIVGHLLGWTENAEVSEHHGMMTVGSGKKFYECIKTHTARRTFATNAYKNGVALSSIMAVTGHSSEAMLRKYLKLDNKERAIIAAQDFEKARRIKLKIAR
jgi:integrase